ncbi:hypothetical protein ACFSO0_00615 [Brevibacillus sp. GCM10020057]|uniref:hypothetical protein n=1 Tax=Brevibacillus sp. GCM10020057 TaxID=3317327 RepID=UPI00363F8DCD
MTSNYLGYHGTTRESADKILSEQRFPFSVDDEEWLGDGVYFFENDRKQAEYWCTKVRKYKAWTVLESQIEASKVIDLLDTETREEFQKIAEKLKDRYHKRKDQKPRKLINAVVLNAMYKIAPYDMVRAAFVIPRGHTVYRTNIEPIHIQLCVRNHSCIKTIREA